MPDASSTSLFVSRSFFPDLLANTLGLLGTPNGNYDEEWTLPGPTKTILSLVQYDQAPFDFCTQHFCIDEKVHSLFVHEDDHGGLSFDQLVVGCSASYPGSIDISNPPSEIVNICGTNDRNCLTEGILGGFDGANMCQTVEITLSDFLVPSYT